MRKYISATALYFLVLTLVLTLFFELWRLLLLFQLRERAATVPIDVLVQSIIVGWRFDFAISCYITLPLYVLGSIPFIDVQRSRLVRVINTVLLFVLSALVFFIQLADMEFFRFFNARLNGMALAWSDTPLISLSMIWRTYPVPRYLLLYAVMLISLVLLLRVLQRKFLVCSPKSSLWINLVYLPLTLLVLFYGARGRIDPKTPLTWGMAYFSHYDFANQLALNPNFTFFRDAVYDLKKKQQAAELVRSIATPDALSTWMNMRGTQASEYRDSEQGLSRDITFDGENPGPSSIILIIMESFGSTKIGSLDNRYRYHLSPCFDSAASRGLLFTNFYSNGMHTYVGIFSTLYGLPTPPGKPILKLVSGQNRFWGLPSILREHGYHTLFFTTHDPHFDNMQGFLKSNGIMDVHSVLDYDPALRISTWGVPDHVMFDKGVEVLRALPDEHYFAVLLTSANHGPWTIPDVPFEHIPSGDPVAEELNAFKYSDWALGHFLDQLDSDSAFNNTLVIITADNGALYEPTADLDLSQFQIPLLIWNRKWTKDKGRRIDRPGSQLDVLPTVMGLVRLNYSDHSFGRDLLDGQSGSTDFAYFSEGSLIGYIENSHYLISRIGSRRSFFDLSRTNIDLADSLPALADSYEKRALAIFQVGFQQVMGVTRDSTWRRKPSQAQ